VTVQGEKKDHVLPNASPNSGVPDSSILINSSLKFADMSHVNIVHDPWDVLRGKDVFKEGDRLKNVLLLANVSHWAPNCATFSRAREIPIVGVKFRPQPLRDQEHPEGLPGLSHKHRARVRKDTALAELAAVNCLN
jgi:hypothetical protein